MKNEIKEALDLREVMTDVRKSGNAYVRVCPFHSDTSPSLQVNKEYFYCHGCQKSGDVYDWIQHEYGLDFKQALAFAAGLAGMDVDESVLKKIGEREEERHKKEEELASFIVSLHAHEEPLEYLYSRGLSAETLYHFKVGYDVDDKSIVVPIFDKHGKLQTFAKRFLFGKQRYKLSNTEDFKAGDNLYNMAESIDADIVYVVEGFFDAMSVWQAGYKNVVALMGSSLNDKKISLIANKRVVFIPDAKKKEDFDLFKKSLLRLKAAKPDIKAFVAVLPEGDPNSVQEDVLATAIQNAKQAEFAVLIDDLAKCIDVTDEYAVAREVCNSIRDVLVLDDVYNFLSERWQKQKEVVKQAMIRSEDAGVPILTIDDGLIALEEGERKAAIDGLGMGWKTIKRYIKRPHTKQSLFFAARTNVGKTMWALNYINMCKHHEVPTLFLSFEQPISELANRLALMATEELKRDLGEMDGGKLHQYIVENRGEWSFIKNYVSLVYPHIRFVEDRLTPEGVRDAIVDASYAIGEQVKVVVIDYFGLMRLSQHSRSDYERMSTVALEMQQVTKSADVFGVYLMQLSRSGGDGTEPVRFDMLRDSGVVEETADYIIGAWKEKDDTQNENPFINRFKFEVLKNRHGELGDGYLWFNKKNLLMTEPEYFNDFSK